MNHQAFETDWERPDRRIGANAALSPRKKPRQERSKALVAALKGACRQILIREGAKQLSAARLADISGVSTASIYEYYPKLEALVAEVLRETIAQASAESASVMILPDGTPLIELLRQLVRRGFEKRAVLAGLHRNIYLRHMQYFEVIEVDTVQRLLQPYSAQITLTDMRLAALVVTNALAGLAQTLLHEDALYMRSAQTQHMMVRMLYAALVDTQADALFSG